MKTGLHLADVDQCEKVVQTAIAVARRPADRYSMK
jgi:hypothetical protein